MNDAKRPAMKRWMGGVSNSGRARSIGIETLERRLVMSAAVASAVPAVVFDAPPMIDVRSDGGVVGDFNEDGRQDIALLDWETVQVLFGSEDSRHLGPPVTVADGEYGDRIRVGDVDADGHADLLITNGAGVPLIQVTRGRGDGTFHPTEIVSAGSGMGGMAVADFNGDGRTDVAIAYDSDPHGESSDQPVIGVHLAAADGTLADAIVHPIDFGVRDFIPLTLAATDFDGDGHIDLGAGAGRVTDEEGNRTGGGVKLLFGTGDGTFSSPVDGHDGLDADQLVAADFDGDGRSDLAARVGGSSVLHILPGQASRTVVSATQIDLSAEPHHLATADMNGDGTLDLLSIGLTGVKVMTTDAAGTFAAPVDHPGIPFGQLLPGDFDGDSRMDLVVRGTDQVIVLAGQKQGILPPVRWAAAPAASAESVMVGNVIGDRRPDLIIGDAGTHDSDMIARTGAGLLVLRGLGRGRFASAVRQDLPDRGVDSVRVVAVADFSGDGRDDVAVRLGDGHLTVWLGGRKGMTAGGEYDSLGDINWFAEAPVAAGRFNADRRFDLAVSGLSGDVRVLISESGGTFAAPVDYPTEGGVNALVAADVDENGTTDIIATASGYTELLSGNGDGTFAPARRGGPAIGTVTGDFDRDGRLDVAGSGVMFGNARSDEPTFKPGLPLPRSSELHASHSADFNRDRIPDLASTSGWMWMGLGDGTFAEPQRVSDAASAVSDFDRDGRPDIAVLDHQGVRILLNRTPATRVSRRPPVPAVTPDASFDQDGVSARRIVGSRDDSASATLVQPDGKIIVAGRSSGLATGIALARLNADGTLDTTFGDAARVVTTVPLPASYPDLNITSLALQPDGKILAAGRTGGRHFLARYNADGQLDAGFAITGIAILPSVGSHLENSDPAVALSPDGSIVVAVSQQASGDYGPYESTLVLVRYDAAGKLDASFGNDGIRERTLDYDNLSAGIAGTPPGLAIAPDGGILVSDALILSRFAADGSDDLTFGGGDGRVGAGYRAYSTGSREHLALLSDGKVIVARAGPPAGVSTDIGEPFELDLMVQRYHSDGTVDASFGTNGRSLLDMAGDDPVENDTEAAFGMVIDANGGIVLATRKSTLVRLTAAGARDTSFGTKLIATPGSFAARPGGGFVSVGSIDPSADVTGSIRHGDITVTAYEADGARDTSFGAGDAVNVDFVGEVRGRISAVATQSDGKLITVGISGVSGDVTVARYNTDGSADNSFGVAGATTVEVGPAFSTSIEAVALQPDGKILVAGATSVVLPTEEMWGRSGFFIARYNPDGMPDGTFGDDGQVTTDFGEETYASIRKLAVLPDGRILAVGSDGLRWALARYMADGRPDPSFGIKGKTTTYVEGQSEEWINVHLPNRAGFVALLPDGRFVVAGSSDPEWDTTEVQPSIGIARYNADGTLDETFADSGTVLALIGSAHPTAAALLPDGRMIIAGSNAGRQTLAAFNADGTRDNAFVAPTGPSGLAPVPGFPRAVLVKPDGKLLVVAVTADSATEGGDAYGSGVVVVTWYNADGTPDTQFGTAGRAVLLTGGEQAFVPAAFTLSAEGHLLMTGSASGRFAFARYLIGR